MTREEAIKNLEGKTEKARVLLKTIPESVRSKCELNEDIEAYELAIEALQERPKGRWVGWHTDKVVGVDDIGDYIYRHCHYYSCRLCGRRTAVKSNFCPNCGADMRGEEE